MGDFRRKKAKRTTSDEYRMRPVHITPPSRGFPRPVSRQPRECQYRTLCQSSRRDVSNAELMGTGTLSTVEISSTENQAQWCVVYTSPRRWGRGFVRSTTEGDARHACSMMVLVLLCALGSTEVAAFFRSLYATETLESSL